MSIKGKSVVTTLSVVSIIVIGLFIYSNVFGQKSVSAYLSDNYKTSEFTEEGLSSSIALIDDSEKYDVFFTGEYHGKSGNEKVSLEMLKYLNKVEGVNYLICEIQYSIASDLNRYLQNGDEELLKNATNSLKEHNPEYAGENYYKFWKELYQYNKNLPKDKRIQAYGIDMDFIPSHTLKELIRLIPKNQPPKEIASVINRFKEILGAEILDEQEVIKVMMDLNKDLNLNVKIYHAFFGNNFNDFNNNLSSMMNTAKYSENQDANRDTLIYDNFMRIYKQNSKGKYYGQFGLNHIFRQDIFSNGKEFFTLGKILEKNGELKVLSIPIIPSNSAELVGEADSLAKGKFTIFKLNGKNSPYKDKNENLLGSSYFAIPNGSTVDNYQYLIYVRNK